MIGEETALRQTPVSRPQLLQDGSSRQSISASEDFYSLSDPESLEDRDEAEPLASSSAAGNNTSAHLFSTPPSRLQLSDADLQLGDNILALDEHAHDISSHATFPSSLDQHQYQPQHLFTASSSSAERSGTTDRAPPPRPPPIFDPRNISSYTKPAAKKPLSSPGASTVSTLASPTAQKFAETHLKMEPPSPSITPGVDDSRIIHFALDQLTRDEEVAPEHMPYPLPVAEDFALPSLPPRHPKPYPVALGNVPPVPPLRSTRRPKSPETQSPIEAGPIAGPIAGPVAGPAVGEDDTEERPSMAREKELMAGTLPGRHPLQQSSEYPSSTSLLQYDVFVPYDPDHSTSFQPPLKYLPRILTPLWLGIYIFLCISMTVCLIFSAVWSKKHAGLWEYISFGDKRYFVFQYLPTLLGMILLLWLQQIEIAMQRIAPFLAMASPSAVSRSKASFLELYPSHFLLPKIQYFETSQYIFGACSISFWLFLFTIPLLASSFNVRYIADVGLGEWRWLAVEGVIWTTTAIYLITIIFLTVLLVYLAARQTGLRWDPRSLADIISLLERSNIASDYAGSETFANTEQFRQRLWTRSDRLGYWHTSRRPQDIFYGIGEEGGATRRYSLNHGRIREKPSRPSTANEPGTHIRGASYSQRVDLRTPDVVKRYLPWQVTPTSLFGFTIFGLVLLIAFYVVAYIKQATTRGFPPKLPAESNKAGFSSANFFYSFLPTLLGMFMFLLWQPLDFTVRRLAPFANMASPGGASPQHSLLLDYPATAPLHITVKAILNRDITVALMSFLSLLSISIPILAGGVFWAQFYSSGTSSPTVKIAAQPSGLYALSFFLAVYVSGLVCFFGIVTFTRRSGLVALPHQSMRLCEIVSWLYMSPLLTDKAFHAPQTRQDMVTKLCATYKGGVSWDEKTIGRGVPTSPRLTVRIVDEADEEETSHNTPVGPWAPPQQPGQSPRTPQRERIVPPPVNPTPPLEARRPERVWEKGEPRFGLGVYVGRDGMEHFGIDRVSRPGKEMIIAEENGRRSFFLR